MKFQLPQFIQTESKIIGPFTLKQFIWIAAGISLIMVMFLFLDGIWFFLFAIPAALVSVTFAFVKIDGLPLINYVTYMLSYGINPKKYTYQKEEEPVYENLPPHEETQELPNQNLENRF